MSLLMMMERTIRLRVKLSPENFEVVYSLWGRGKGKEKSGIWWVSRPWNATAISLSRFTRAPYQLACKRIIGEFGGLASQFSIPRASLLILCYQISSTICTVASRGLSAIVGFLVEMWTNPNPARTTEPEPRFCQEPNRNPKVKMCLQEPKPNPTP